MSDEPIDVLKDDGLREFVTGVVRILDEALDRGVEAAVAESLDRGVASAIAAALEPIKAELAELRTLVQTITRGV